MPLIEAKKKEKEKVESILPIGRWLSIIFLLLMGPHYINK
jgi:hypothetical protein